MSEIISYNKAGASTLIMPEGVGMYELAGVNFNAEADKKPKKKREWTRNGDWVNWGKNNNFPEEVMRDLRESTIGKRILSDRAKRHVGAGIAYYTKKVEDNRLIEVPLYIPEIEDYLEANKVFAVQKAIVEDLETFFNAMPYFRLGRGGKLIASYGYKKMIHCRFGEMEEGNNHIDKIFHSYNWPNPKIGDDKDVVDIDIYDEKEPLKHKRFVYPLRYSTSDECLYYELAIWDSVRQNGWMAIDQLVPKLKQHIFENQAILKYHIKIPYDYWYRKYGAKCWEGKTEAEKNDAIQNELQNMDTFLKGAENSGKSFISFYGHDPVTNKPYPGWEIVAIDNKLKSDDYLPDATAAYSAICFAMGYDPTLIGAGLIDKRSSGGSGSDKRESLTNLQSSMPIDRMVSLEPLRLITRVNKWNEKYASQLNGGRIHWAYIDTDTSQTLNEISPKDRNNGGKPINREIA
jgi:hypothetical protein